MHLFVTCAGLAFIITGKFCLVSPPRIMSFPPKGFVHSVNRWRNLSTHSNAYRSVLGASSHMKTSAANISSPSWLLWLMVQILSFSKLIGIWNSLHFTSLHFAYPYFVHTTTCCVFFVPLHFTSLHFTSLHFTSLHSSITSLHYTSLHIFLEFHFFFFVLIWYFLMN